MMFKLVAIIDKDKEDRVDIPNHPKTDIKNNNTSPGDMDEYQN